MPNQVSNGDETHLPGYIGCFAKGLPHDQFGEVEADAYKSLLFALSTGHHADFENILRGSGMKLVNPEAAFTFELEGADSHCLACPPAPSVSSAAAAAEMVELYWQALARDVPFADYENSPLIQAAVQDLSKLVAFQGPTQPNRSVSPAMVFRGTSQGCLDGPYISQFLWKPIPVNSTWVDQRYRAPAAGIDYLTDYAEWLVLLSGLPPYRDPRFNPSPQYIANGRA
ncbi:MAG TPA: phosphoesterase, partial [Verrucomicrobiae bacterium]|nr:phosphoesterase [Verrucomicrobiae bacterium]